MSGPALPDARGRYGAFGGRYVPETLVPALLELERAWRAARADPAFDAELNELLERYTGRETPLSGGAPDERARAAAACCSSARTSATPARTS